MSSTSSRREFLAGGAAAGGTCLLTLKWAGLEAAATPAQARAAAVPLRTLSADEARSLDTIGDIVLPGSAAAGLSHYIDHQLSGSACDSMLMIKYLGVLPPYQSFYKDGLHSLGILSTARFARPVNELDASQGTTLVTEISGGQPQPWHGPPAGLFYFVIRSDAIDVTYGTQAGFARLGIPYMPHIAPQSEWGQ